MRTLLACAIVLAFPHLGLAQSEGWVLSSIPVVSPGEAPVAPSLDGNLSELGWSKATTLRLPGENRMLDLATLHLAVERSALYVAWEIAGGRDTVRAQAKERDSAGILGDDAFELVLDPGPSLDSGLRVIVTARGTIYDEAISQGGLSTRASTDIAGLETAVRVGEMRWSGEMRLPWASLGLTGAGEFIGINWAVRSSDGSRVAWIATDCETDLVGIGLLGMGTKRARGSVALDVVSLTVEDETAHLRVGVRNPLNEPMQYLLRTRLGSAGRVAFAEQTMLYIDTDERLTLPLGPITIAPGSPMLLTFTVDSARKRAALRPVEFVAFVARPAED